MTTATLTPTRPPRVIRRCFFCGTNTPIPRLADDFLLEIHENGRSFNFCRKHWRKLLRYASAAVVERYRRLRLTRCQPSLAAAISDLKVTKNRIALV